MIDWLGRFNGQVRAFLPGSKWLGALPEVPGQSEAQGRITQPMDDANTLWQQINADPGTAAPITLLGGYDQASFDTDLTALKAAYTTVNGSETTLKVTRAERNTLQDDLYAMLKSYRQVLPTLFAKDDALVTTLPACHPRPAERPTPSRSTGPGMRRWSRRASTGTPAPT